MTASSEEDEYQDIAGRAERAARAGQVDEAERLVREIPVPLGFSGWGFEKVVALISIATTLVERGLTARAKAILTEARTTCEAIEDGAIWEDAHCLAQIAELLARTDARDEAIVTWLKAVRRAADHQDQDVDCLKILGSIARGLAASGETRLAVEAAHRIKNDVWRDRALAGVAEEVARAGRLDDAERLVSEMSRLASVGRGFEQATVLIQIAAKLVERGLHQPARAFLAEAEAACKVASDKSAYWQNADCLARIAVILAKMGTRGVALAAWLKAAQAVPEHEDWEVDRDDTLVAIASGLAGMGETGSAAQVAHRIMRQDLRERILREIAARTQQ